MCMPHKKELVEKLKRECYLSTPKIIRAFMDVPREEFMAPDSREYAHLDKPFLIGNGQTISAPHMVAMMTELLELKGNEKVLEIGTGSGYQAAILAELAKQVFTIERVRELMVNAQKSLFGLGYKNIKFRVGDGTLGWPEEAPFDGIIVTAGAPIVPHSLVNQLKDGGKLVIPVGDQEIQKLLLIEKEGEKISEKYVTHCRFVKLIGEEGWKITEE